MVDGVNQTYYDNKGRVADNVNWSGLNYLYTNFESFIKDFKKFVSYLKTVDDISSKNFDLAKTEYDNLTSGINEFWDYIRQNTFRYQDPNDVYSVDYDVPFNVTYFCRKCKDFESYIFKISKF